MNRILFRNLSPYQIAILSWVTGFTVGCIAVFFITNGKLDKEIWHNDNQCRQMYPPNGTQPGGGTNDQNKIVPPLEKK
jgi:uncharacterized protein YneF (UPF0154 family)